MLVMEYCATGDLLHFVKRKDKLTEIEAKRMFKQIIMGARECHEHNVLHRDFKLDNILIDRHLKQIKICDFGVSKLIKRNEVIYDQCGTPAYLAPEIAAERGYVNFYVDIWSLGVLLYTMLCGVVPFKAPSIPELYKLILKGKY
jgi:serine/threonine protein kinase